MSAKALIDTNLFIYRLENLDTRKSAIAEEIIREGIETGNACVSFQVVAETLNTVLRMAEIPLDSDSAHDYLQLVLAPLCRIPATMDLYHRALEIQGRYRYGFYDALIIAAALSEGCSRLYTEDMQDGQHIDGLTIVNPFTG